MQRHGRPPLQTFFPHVDKGVQQALEPRRFLGWLYVGRLSIASAVFVAAVARWQIVDPQQTLIATLSFVGALLFTGGSFLWTDVRSRPATSGFLYAQLVADLLVVTATVHVTRGGESPFAALYILVNAAAALLLPIGGALLIALLGNVMYVADALSMGDSGAGTALLWQLVVFSLAALGVSYIGSQMGAAGRGREALAAELATVRLREKDILANIRSGILSVDDEGTLLFANPFASELLALDLDARLGRPVLDELRATIPVLGEALDRAIRRHEHVTRTEGSVERGGRAFALGVTTTSSDGDGRHIARSTTAIFQDISDQKTLEQLNLRAQRLEAVTELSASLAHEIKNPLASIRSAVEQMSLRPAAGDDERTLGNLIVRESDRLSRLLSEFLDFARVRVTRREPVDLAGVVRGAAGLALQHPSRSTDVALDLDVPGTPLLVLGDEDLLHRAVFNLVLNALQVAPPGSRVRLSAGVAEPRELPRTVPFDSGALAVHVSDEGPGIPASVQDRLFEPFTTTKPGGSGLGLAIAHRAIEAHRGLVLVDTSGRGTRFTVLLPRADQGST